MESEKSDSISRGIAMGKFDYAVTSDEVDAAINNEGAGMSLLDEARERQGKKTRMNYCGLAAAIYELDDVAEIIELLKAPDIQMALKLTILNEKGVSIAGSTLHGKVRRGCKCGWCVENIGTGSWVAS